MTCPLAVGVIVRDTLCRSPDELRRIHRESVACRYGVDPSCESCEGCRALLVLVRQSGRLPRKASSHVSHIRGEGRPAGHLHVAREGEGLGLLPGLLGGTHGSTYTVHHVLHVMKLLQFLPFLLHLLHVTVLMNCLHLLVHLQLLQMLALLQNLFLHLLIGKLGPNVLVDARSWGQGLVDLRWAGLVSMRLPRADGKRRDLLPHGPQDLGQLPCERVGSCVSFWVKSEAWWRCGGTFDEVWGGADD
mmetsp:Transcript_48449/g.87053  ORF Transcript_48449/g.87053 Transcript_48449/m.87053 type:complete len:246 (-) Transcript_48449:1148-1885(-)